MAAGQQVSLGFGLQVRASQITVTVDTVTEHPAYKKALADKVLFLKSPDYKKLMNKYETAKALDENSTDTIKLENQLNDCESTIPFDCGHNVPKFDVPDLAVIKFRKTEDLKKYLSSIKIAVIERTPLDPTKTDIAVAGYGCTDWDGPPASDILTS